ncbi:MAG: tetratricopeptide repeat protein [Bacillota bacterium]
MEYGQVSWKPEPGHADWGSLIARAERGLRRQGLPPENEVRLRYWLGLALIETGDLYRAEQEWNRLLVLSREVGAKSEMEAEALYRLGQVHRLLRRPDQAVAAFREAARRYRRTGQGERAARCHGEAGWTLLTAGRAEEALPELEAAEAGLGQRERSDLGRDLGVARALYLSLIGEREASDRLCLSLLDQPPLRAGQRAEIAWILGCNALAAGDHVTADLHAAIAHEYALEAWWPPQMERVEGLRRRVASAAAGSRL